LFKDYTPELFNAKALEIFSFQCKNIEVYSKYLEVLKTPISKIQHYTEIPFLPIEFFKEWKVIGKSDEAEIVFESSGTSGQNPSKHYVKRLNLYRESFRKAFELFYDSPSEYCILALLPSYLERQGSSLVLMVKELMEQSSHSSNAFFLDDFEGLHNTLKKLKAAQQKTILIGVTFGILDFLEKYKIEFPELIVMETGGMKGRRKELLRSEVHAIIKDGFNIENVHSEYGMTELLSQGYSNGKGIFKCPPWMKVLVRDVNDPFSYCSDGKTGGVNIIDFANLHSCSFIATQDLGRKLEDDSFEILGRFDQSEIRGCNLMVG